MTSETIMESLKKELKGTLQSDPVFSHEEFHDSMFDVGTNAPKPCHSIDLDRDTPPPDNELEYSGGVINNYVVEGILISYIEPDTARDSIGAMLEKYRDTAKALLQGAQDSNAWTNIKEYKYLESYPMPWTEAYNTETRVVAHRMVTKFLIYYEVR